MQNIVDSRVYYRLWAKLSFNFCVRKLGHPSNLREIYITNSLHIVFAMQIREIILVIIVLIKLYTSLSALSTLGSLALL